MCVRRATEAPVQRVHALLEVVEHGVVRGRIGGEGRDGVLRRGEHRLRVLEALADRVRPREQQGGGQVRTVRHRPLGERGAEVGVPGEERGAGRVEDDRRGDRGAGVEQPARDTQRVIGRERIAPLDCRGQPQAQLACAEHRERATHDLAVQRVREAHVPAGGRRVDQDHAVGLGVDDGLGARHRDELVEPQRLAERQQLDRLALLVAQRAHAGRDELDEARAHRRAARKPPEAALERERPRVDRPEHQLVDVQGVALAALGDPAQRGLLDGAPSAPSTSAATACR